MKYIKKIKDKSELFMEDGTLKVHDLSNYDISDIDLSDFNPEVWEGVYFYHTNLKNTGIKFYPRKLQMDNFHCQYSLELCNLENCDLSYLKDEDFRNVVIIGTNFKNTNLQIDFCNNRVFLQTYNVYQAYNCRRVNLTHGTILSSWYTNKTIDYFDYAELDIEFLKNNPTIKISSGKLLKVIINYFRKEYHEGDFINDEEFERYYQLFLNFLEYDYEGKLKKFYEDMKQYLTSKEQYLLFFCGVIKNIDFEELDLTYLDKKMLILFLFCNCKISKLKLGVSYKELNEATINASYICFLQNTSVGELDIPVTIHDYQNCSYKRLFKSNITMHTNLYLEFERICNMHCEFCRNEALEEFPFDFDKVMKTLKDIKCHLNSIVIGGGEPTLYLNELILIGKEKIQTALYIITNGSLDYEVYNFLNRCYNYKFYFSRHAVADSDNRKIFGDKHNKILTTDDLKKINDRNEHVLCCTCFRGGVDTASKFLEYVRYAEYLGYNNILFQNLHLEDEYNISINIPERVMLEAMEKLSEKGFLVKRPIVSNSNYILYLLKKNNITISFKIYKQRDIILDAWNKSPKRCFDLSINPSGNLYETWKEESDIKILRKEMN